MSIKGTLETFNLRELLQMLAFNQKVGTLVLETERGTRTIHVDRGRTAFVSGDPIASRALSRVVRRRSLVPEERLERGWVLHERTGRFLGDVLGEMGVLDASTRAAAYEEAVAECFLDLQLTSITRFEFEEGKCLAPNGSTGTPIEPSVVVEGLLLDLTRKMDQWTALSQLVPSFREIYESTGIAVDLSSQEDLEPTFADRVVPLVDGARTLDEVSEASDVDRFTVLRVAAALLEGGGIRTVPVDDLVLRADGLLARSEARTALSLLRRAIEREGSPAWARLRMADALEQVGERPAAAQELDTFAVLSDGSDHPAVFDALERALALRDGDPLSAGRLCDYYLRHRPWLRDRAGRAAEVLRLLIERSTAEGKPLDAAVRLAAFLDSGDAPPEDLLVLADLYAAGGERREAADALHRRGEMLLGVQRTPAARTLFLRALELDGSRGDARQRLREIDGRESRRRHRKRIVLLVSLTLLLILGGAAGLLFYRDEMKETLRNLKAPAEAAVVRAETRGAAAVAEFVHRMKVLAADESMPTDGMQVVEKLYADMKEITTAPQRDLQAFGSSLQGFGGANGGGPNETLHYLEGRVEAVDAKARAAVADVRRESEEALAEGERSFATGRFVAARRLLLAARNLAFHDSGARARAIQLLSNVDTYLGRCEDAKRQMADALGKGDVEKAFGIGVALLAENFESDATRDVKLPVRVTSAPNGAEVWIAGRRAECLTPCVLLYSPFEATEVRVRMAGHSSWTQRLPDFKRIKAENQAVLAWKPEIGGPLTPGVRWRISSSPTAYAQQIWSADGVPLLLTRDGSRIYPVDAEHGQLGSPTNVLVSGQPVRRCGTVPGAFEWRYLGRRVLQVRTAAGGVWEANVLGNLEQSPALVEDVLAVVDEAGTAYGYRVGTGEELWRRSLGAGPAQALWASDVGFLIALTDGGAYALSPSAGSPRRLAAAGTRTLVLPRGDGALLLGGGRGGLRRVKADLTVEVIGDAAPVPTRPVWVGSRALAWCEADAVRWFTLETPAPVAVPALGTATVGLTGDGDVLYAVDEAGVARAARPGRPAEPLWQVPVGGRVSSSPLVAGNALLMLVDGGVVAVER